MRKLTSFGFPTFTHCFCRFMAAAKVLGEDVAGSTAANQGVATAAATVQQSDSSMVSVREDEAT